MERLNVTDAVPAWIFPIYPLLVVGTLAGTILPAQPNGPSWNIFIGGVLLQGVAWVVSFLMYAIYMQRLMTGNLPSPSTRPGMYVSVGPAGKLSSFRKAWTHGSNNRQVILPQASSRWPTKHPPSLERTTGPKAPPMTGT
jgi:tellurite resistance protein TehA-like permease